MPRTTCEIGGIKYNLDYEKKIVNDLLTYKGIVGTEDRYEFSFFVAKGNKVFDNPPEIEKYRQDAITKAIENDENNREGHLRPSHGIR